MSGNLEILVQNDAFLEALADAIEAVPDRIQGFLYGEHHVIRDVYRPYGEQVLWRQAGSYDETHAAMMRQIRVEQLRLAVESVLSGRHRSSAPSLPQPHPERNA